jgi:hypothetical protein
MRKSGCIGQCFNQGLQHWRIDQSVLGFHGDFLWLGFRLLGDRDRDHSLGADGGDIIGIGAPRKWNFAVELAFEALHGV